MDLADAVWPTWDASGKYLWFLASTDFGLRSQWLDMTSYDRETTFGLYFAVLKKGEPSPLLPESDEDRGVGTGRRPQPGACELPGAGGGGPAAAAAPGGGEGAPAAGGPGGEAAAPPRGPRGPVGGADRFRRTATADHRRSRRAGTPVHGFAGGC